MKSIALLQWVTCTDFLRLECSLFRRFMLFQDSHRQLITAPLRVVENPRILELGCGAGHWARYFKSLSDTTLFFDTVGVTVNVQERCPQTSISPGSRGGQCCDSPKPSQRFAKLRVQTSGFHERLHAVRSLPCRAIIRSHPLYKAEWSSHVMGRLVQHDIPPCKSGSYCRDIRRSCLQYPEPIPCVLLGSTANLAEGDSSQPEHGSGRQ